MCLKYDGTAALVAWCDTRPENERSRDDFNGRYYYADPDQPWPYAAGQSWVRDTERKVTVCNGRPIARCEFVSDRR